MVRIVFGLVLVGLLCAMVGCSTYPNPYDYTYPAYGGSCPDGACGSRSNSTFVPANAALAPVPESMIVSDQRPTVAMPSPASRTATLPTPSLAPR